MENYPGSAEDYNSEVQLSGYKIYSDDRETEGSHKYQRKDFYKICLFTGNSLINYAHTEMTISGTTLFFGNPHIPYCWNLIKREETSYPCLFSEAFFKTGDRSVSLQDSPLFKIGGTPIFSLNDEQKNVVLFMFKRMLLEQQTMYTFRSELIRNYINLIIHEALKMRPAVIPNKHKNASARITSLFMELLERQFPIEHEGEPLRFSSPDDFAKELSMHVNHLNRSVKHITGRSTSSLISERIINEAKTLLLYTDWSIASIAHTLGFEYPTYFNNYFKKLPGIAPSTIRLQQTNSETKH